MHFIVLDDAIEAEESLKEYRGDLGPLNVHRLKKEDQPKNQSKGNAQNPTRE